MREKETTVPELPEGWQEVGDEYDTDPRIELGDIHTMIASRYLTNDEGVECTGLVALIDLHGHLQLTLPPPFSTVVCHEVMVPFTLDMEALDRLVRALTETREQLAARRG